MQPFVGQPVLVDGIHSNGATVHPGIVNRVWSDRGDGAVLVNVVVFPDCSPPVTRGSIPMLAGPDAPRGIHDAVACWPQ